MITPLEIKGAVAAIVTSVVILLATFTAGEIYRDHRGRETEPGNKPVAAEDLAAKGRSLKHRAKRWQKVCTVIGMRLYFSPWKSL
jgi:hypothetical protein